MSTTESPAAANTHETSPAQYPPYYVKALAMAIPAIMLGFQISGWIFFLPGVMQGHCDFRHLYTAGYMVRTGHRGELYDYAAEKKFQDALVSPESIALPFNHLAYEALLFVPYSLLPYRSAYFVFLATNVVVLMAVLRLMLPWMRSIHDLLAWLPAALFVTFLPVAAALMQGQDSILILLLAVAAMSLLNKKETFWSGLLLGVGLFKFQIVIPIVVLFLLWRRWRFAAGVAVSGSLALLISVLLVGTSQLNVYAQTLLSTSIHETAIDQLKFNVVPAMMPNFRGLFAALFGAKPGFGWAQSLTILASAAVLACTGLRGNRRALTWQFPVAVIAATLCSYHLLIHDLAILSIPLALILNRYFLQPGSHTTAPLLSVITFCAPAVMALSDVHPFVVAVPVFALWLTQISSSHSEWSAKAGAANLGAEFQ
jgi:hypothetical protein